MKQYKYLYKEMLKPDVIRKAYKNLRKGKTKREEIKKIDENYDEEAAAMRAMIENTRPARKLKAAKEAGRAYYLKHIQGMVSYMGWFDCTDSYNCYCKYLKPYFRFGKLKEIISILQRRQNKNEKLAGRALRREAGSVAGNSA